MKRFHLLICLLLFLNIDSSAIRIYDGPGSLEILSSIGSQKDTLNLSATIYNFSHMPLLAFENESEFDTCFSWSFIQFSRDSSIANFIDSIGPHCSLIIHDSEHINVKIRCIFHWASDFLDDTFTLMIINPSHDKDTIMIESNYDSKFSPMDPVPLTLIHFSSPTDTFHVYAIKRDRFGNYISPCKNCTWVSSSNSFGIKRGIDSLGELLIFPNSLMEDGTLYCYDSLGDTSNSVQVQIAIETAIKNSKPKNQVSNISFTSRMYNIKGQKIDGKVSKSIYISNDGKSNSLITNFTNKNAPQKAEPRKQSTCR